MSDATQILKSGAVDKAADLLHKLAGPMCEEVGAIFGDKLRVYRVKNLVATIHKTERILRDANLEPNAVPPRLLLPIIENSSIEENETLQEMWVGLLATASHMADSVSPSFAETLKQLTPNEARHLEKIILDLTRGLHVKKIVPGRSVSPMAFSKIWQTPTDVSASVYERLGLIQREYKVDLNWRQAKSLDEALNNLEPEIKYTFVFTDYAVRFLEACHGPRQEAS